MDDPTPSDGASTPGTSDFGWHPEPGLFDLATPGARAALEALGREAWELSLDYLYDEALVRPVGPDSYQELRRRFFGPSMAPSPAPAAPTSSSEVLDEVRRRVGDTTLVSPAAHRRAWRRAWSMPQRRVACARTARLPEQADRPSRRAPRASPAPPPGGVPPPSTTPSPGSRNARPDGTAPPRPRPTRTPRARRPALRAAEHWCPDRARWPAAARPWWSASRAPPAPGRRSRG